MIIYGSRATHIHSERVSEITCPNCKNKGSVSANVYSRHAHVFWIPLFPAGRTGIMECQECHAGFKKKDLDDSSRMAYKNFNGNIKTPLWKYSGLAIIAVLIGFAIYSSKMKDGKIKEWVENPRMFDTYTFKTETGYYSTFKVAEVFQDSIYVNYNDYETDKLSGVYKIDKKVNYSNLVYMLTDAEIQQMHKEGLIKDIER